MTATAIHQLARVLLEKPAPKSSRQKPMTFEAFQRRYLAREDGYKYEWVGGTVEKTIRSMDKTQLYLLLNLLNRFDLLKSKGKVAGALISEPDLLFLENHRRPDIAWLTTEQIYRLADPEANEVPAFVIEVISTNDQLNKMKLKMANYRDAGVQVVWHVFPNHQQVDVYSGPDLGEMKVCSGDKICSAAPALPGFEVVAREIFEKFGK